ncbi:hypothetical protein AAMO2058_000332200, partial [Amorphochlora amoebiformis]
KKRQREICWEFQKGRCERGSQCRFAHEVNAGSQHKRRHQDDTASLGENVLLASSVPCRFFESGYCKFGVMCRFSHKGVRRVIDAMEQEVDSEEMRLPENNEDQDAPKTSGDMQGLIRPSSNDKPASTRDTSCTCCSDSLSCHSTGNQDAY